MFILSLCLATQDIPSLNATYKTPTTVLLEWTFAFTPISSYSYVAYYQSGGEGYSVAFTIDSLERDNRHQLTGLPGEFTVAITYKHYKNSRRGVLFHEKTGRL